MSSKAIDYKIILKHDGQTQRQRMPQWLDPALIPVDGRTREDMYKFVQKIALQINFWDLDPATQQEVVNGSWENFFHLSLEEADSLAASSSMPPHLALWFCFNELMEKPKALMNTLTKRHLDFYYQEVLGLKKSEPVQDRAHVVFELKKNTENTLLPAGTILSAGKDNTQKELNYKLTHDIIVNRSKVAELKALYVNPVNKNFLHQAPVVRSLDGLGAVLDPQNPKWSAFGSSDLALAQVGFCLGSDVLRMKEGNRNVKVKLTIRNLNASSKNPVLTSGLFKVSITGEKGWIGPKLASVTITSSDNQLFNASFSFNVSKDEPSVIGYNKDTHGGNFDTIHPLLQVLINNEKADFGYRDLINAELVNSTIEVEVSEVTSLELENDFGTLDPKKPFTPFGPLSETNSNFYVKCEEAFTKRLKEFSIDIDWKNIPDPNLGNYYVNYGLSNNNNSNFTAVVSFKDGFSWQEKYKTVQLFNSSNAQAASTWKFTNPAYPVKFPLYTIPYFVPTKYINPGQSVQQAVSASMSHLLPGFSTLKSKATPAKANLATSVLLYKPILYSILGVYKEIRKGQLQVRLNHGFLFKEYREKYTAEILRFGRDGATLKLPAEPFAPEIQSISLNYTATTASTGFSGTSLNDYANEEIEFFHSGVYGQMREHAYTRSKHPFLKSNLVKLVPEYIDEGSFLIGLVGLNSEDSVSILFQVAEGSANPEKPKVEIKWSVLCDNYWRALNNEDFIFDTTNGLLTSGVIKMVVPKEATTSNTILPEGRIWLKASVAKDSDGVSKLLDVQTNAAIAIFDNRGNDPQHLATPLPANKISKLKNDTGAIKKVSQPYSSFGGRMDEDDHAYYIRVSERLRHKERSIAIWDYERLILQHFPSIYKVKCINHATIRSFYSPGSFLIVVVPDLTNQNAVDPLQPKVDKNTLDEVDAFLLRHSSAWTKFQVINPQYEPVQISVRLKLRRGFEFNYYQKIVDQKIREFLSPWINNGGRDIYFGGKVTKSMVIKYLEDLGFVDYITAFSMFQYSPIKKAFGGNVEVAEASSPASVLVSAPYHEIINE